jgi:alpha-D-xyloside xylohydrolase
VQFGFLWNVPAYGGVNLSYTDDHHSTRRTTWTAHAVTQLDYFIATSSASAGASAAAGEIMRAFADAVGHAPPLPSFAAGYWHSKNRYESAEQLLDAARGFYSRKSQKRD